MKSSTLTTLVAALALAAPVSFAGAAGSAGPARSAEPAACHQAAEQLPELLATPMQRIGSEGEVRAEFEVNARGQVRPISVDGHRRYRSFVRSALYSLDCKGGTPQRYVLNIRFAETAPTSLAKASAPMIAISEVR